VALLVEVREDHPEREHREPGCDLVREREEHARRHRGVHEPHALPEQREQHDAEEELLHDGDETGAEREVDDEPREGAVRRGGHDEGLRVRPDDLRLRVRDDDREQPQTGPRPHAERGVHRRSRPKVREAKLRPDA
jgi:hypothetical protein